jgi:hypothetical protein
MSIGLMKNAWRIGGKRRRPWGNLKEKMMTKAELSTGKTERHTKKWSREIVRACYEWQVNNLKVDGWAKKLNQELRKIGLAFIWQSQSEINVNIYNEIRERCNDIERQNIF